MGNEEREARGRKKMERMKERGERSSTTKEKETVRRNMKDRKGGTVADGKKSFTHFQRGAKTLEVRTVRVTVRARDLQLWFFIELDLMKEKMCSGD